MQIYFSRKISQRAVKSMVKKILTRFAVAKKQSRSRDSVYRSPRIYLPTKLTDDSVFPFKEGDILSVRVDGRKLVIQRMQKASTAEITSSESRQKS